MARANLNKEFLCLNSNKNSSRIGIPIIYTKEFKIWIFLFSSGSKVHTVHTVKSAVSLKWQVGFENDMKMAPIFTIIFVSKILI